MPRFLQGTTDHDGDGHMGGSRKESTMTEKGNAKQADTAKADATRNDRVLFEQGRTAATGGISEEDAPYDKSDPAHRVWLKGYKSVER